jgi:hypothetical protein
VLTPPLILDIDCLLPDFAVAVDIVVVLDIAVVIDIVDLRSGTVESM